MNVEKSKNIIMVLLIVAILVLSTGQPVQAGPTSNYESCGIFVIYRQDSQTSIYVDTETHVCYLHSGGAFTLMVDDIGRPKLWGEFN